MRSLLKPASLMILLTLCGCSGKKENISEMSFPQLYNAAMDHLKEERFAKAANYFEEVDKQHPYSAWAAKAQLMAGFSFYMDQKYVEAEGSFESFLDLHPGHKDAPYALYMVGICQYEQIASVRRDQKATQNVLDTFNTLIRRYPQTVYARDAKLRLDLLKDHLAGKELDIARYYVKHHAYESAIPRLQGMINKYEKTLQVREAMYRLVESYLGMGLNDEAKRVAAVLGHNYPESHWYTEAYSLMGRFGSAMTPAKGAAGQMAPGSVKKS